MAYIKNFNDGKKNGRKRIGGGNKVPKTYVKVQVPVAYSDYYADNIDSLYNLLATITFDKIVINVKAGKSELFNNPELEGTIVVGNVVKFNNDNTFTISVPEKFAKTITDGQYVVSVRCRKDFTTNEFTYVTDLYLIKGKSIDDHFSDITIAFTSFEDEENVNNSEEDTTTSETKTEISE